MSGSKYEAKTELGKAYQRAGRFNATKKFGVRNLLPQEGPYMGTYHITANVPLPAWLVDPSLLPKKPPAVNKQNG